MKVWHEGMTDKETADLAYWERNMLALYYAQGWYYDDVEVKKMSGSYTGPRYEGWRRVLSLDHGLVTFHIPDDFDVGDLPCIVPNWNGHTTEEKWKLIQESRGIE